ncbi:MAG: ABC transporter permease [Alphaproteobacteria bacterium]
MPGRLVALVIKELLAVWRDPRSRMMLIIPPILQLVVFAYGANFDVIGAPFAVLDRDGGPAARALIDRFAHSSGFHLVRTLTAEAEIAAVVDSREAVMVLGIPGDFARRLERRDAAATVSVQVIVDGRMSNTAQILLGYANAVIDAFNRDWADTHGLRRPPSALVPVSWFNPNLVTRWFIVPGLVALLTMVVGLVVTALSVARERELGTFEQLLVTPLNPWEIMIGKTLPGLMIGMAQGAAIVLIAQYWFGVPLLGSSWLLYAGLVTYLLSVIGVGLMVSALARTQQQAILGAFLFVTPAIILSGFATPIENMPEWVQFLTLADPVRYFLVIVRGVFLKDLSPALVWAELWPMGLIAVATLVAAAWLFRRRMY